MFSVYVLFGAPDPSGVLYTWFLKVIALAASLIAALHCYLAWTEPKILLTDRGLRLRFLPFIYWSEITQVRLHTYWGQECWIALYCKSAILERCSPLQRLRYRCWGGCFTVSGTFKDVEPEEVCRVLREKHAECVSLQAKE